MQSQHSHTLSLCCCSCRSKNISPALTTHTHTLFVLLLPQQEHLPCTHNIHTLSLCCCCRSKNTSPALTTYTLSLCCSRRSKNISMGKPADTATDKVAAAEEAVGLASALHKRLEEMDPPGVADVAKFVQAVSK